MTGVEGQTHLSSGLRCFDPQYRLFSRLHVGLPAIYVWGSPHSPTNAAQHWTIVNRYKTVLTIQVMKNLTTVPVDE